MQHQLIKQPPSLGSYWGHVPIPFKYGCVVGPGFTRAFIPGYPANPESPVLQTDCKEVRPSPVCTPEIKLSHNFREIDFVNPESLDIGAFHGYDYFGDGSFYLLDAPGYSIGHICAITRTTTSTDKFVFMGADTCHHNGEFRHSIYHPLPKSISPNPLERSAVHACPGESWAEYLKSSGRSTGQPFFGIPKTSVGASYNHSVPAAIETIEKVKDTGSGEDILVIIAHDESIKGIVSVFPASINDGKEKPWGISSRWAFLADFQKVWLDIRPLTMQ